MYSYPFLCIETDLLSVDSSCNHSLWIRFCIQTSCWIRGHDHMQANWAVRGVRTGSLKSQPRSPERMKAEGPRGPGGSREYLGRGPPPGSGRCFNCGIDGHWARDCKAGDWKNKCYRCGERGHIERNCQNSPKNLRRGRSYSRSASRSPSPRRGRSRSRSYSRSRSPPARRERERSKSPAYSRSPSRDASPPPKERRHSPSPGHSRSPRASRSPPPEERKKLSEERNGAADYSPSPRARDSRSPRDTSMSPSPKERKAASNERNGSDYEQSPRRGRKSRSRSPMSEENGSPYAGRRYRSPEATNGRSVSPRDDDEDVGRRPSPRGDESPQD